MVFKPIKKETTVNEVIRQIENNIISGKLKIGSKLPSERELAKMLEVSRPVVRESLILLKEKGLIDMIPRKGNYINDYRIKGSLPILESLISFQSNVNNKIENELLESLLQTRKLIECETASLAAVYRKIEDIEKLKIINEEEYKTFDRLFSNNLKEIKLNQIVELDFSFHHCVAIASGNSVYPLLINSFKNVYTYLTSTFFNSIIENIKINPEIIEQYKFVIERHGEIIVHIEKKDSKNCKNTMLKLLEHGEILLKKQFNKE